MKAAKKTDALVDAMNTFAGKLLEGAEESGLTNKVEVFSAVTKWVAVKNRLNLVDESEGSKINAYRDALADTPAPGAIHRTHKSNPPWSNNFRNPEIRKRAQRAQGRTIESIPGNGGEALDSIKSRLPHADDSDHVDDRDDAVSAVPVAPEWDRGLPAWLDDDPKPGRDEARSEPDV